MSFKLNETAVQFAQRTLEAVTKQEDSAAQLQPLTLRISEETLTILYYLGNKLRLSSTVLAEELLCRAVEEVFAALGQPKEEVGRKLIIPSVIDAAPRIIETTDKSPRARRTRKAAGLYDSNLHNPKRKVKAISKG